MPRLSTGGGEVGDGAGVEQGSASPVSDTVSVGTWKPKAKIIEVPGYGWNGKRDPLEVIVHGPAGVGKTTLACTLPGPSAWVISEPGATAPILHKFGMDRVPRIVARNFDEFVAGGPTVGHKGFHAFAAALPPAITWIVFDTFSTLMMSQHAIHLDTAEKNRAKKEAEAILRNKAPPGLDKFWVLDNDLNKARLVQGMVQAAGRNILYLAHMSPMSGEVEQDAKSTTAGRPVVPGQFRTFLEAWASGILHLVSETQYVKSGKKLLKTQVPRISLTNGQQPLVKQKWGMSGSVDPDLDVLLRSAGEWPR